MTITITVDVDGNAVSREYRDETDVHPDRWGRRIEDMLDTIEKSKEEKF